jgi:hypothetical protein
MYGEKYNLINKIVGTLKKALRTWIKRAQKKSKAIFLKCCLETALRGYY